jgi:hypothetical protein
MPDVQQIETSVRGYNLLASTAQRLAVIRKFFELHNFRAHFTGF